MSRRLLYLLFMLPLVLGLAACSTTRTQVRPLGQQTDGALVLTQADLRVAASALQSGDAESARTLYQELLALHPDSSEVWLGLGNAYFLEGEFVAARQAYDQAVELDPALTDAQLAQARVALRMRELDRARRQYEAILQQHPNMPIALAGLGVVYELQGDPQRAQSLYRQGLQAHPGDQALRANLGLSLALSGQAREAVNILLGHAGAANSRLPQLHDNLALAYGLLGREDAAKEILSRYQPRSLVQDNLAFYEYLRQQHHKLDQGYAGAVVSSRQR